MPKVSTESEVEMSAPEEKRPKRRRKRKRKNRGNDDYTSTKMNVDKPPKTNLVSSIKKTAKKLWNKLF